MLYAVCRMPYAVCSMPYAVCSMPYAAVCCMLYAVCCRLYDMMLTILRKRKSTHYVLIDTYSGLAFCYAFVCAMLCRAIGLSYLPILRGGDLPKMLLKNKMISKMIFSYSKINISPSLYMKSKFQEIGLQTKYIPNTIDIRYAPPSPR